MSLKQTADGVYKYSRKGKKKKKHSKRLRGSERGVDQLTSALSTFGNEYQRRHHNSNRKKKDGWVKDGRKNVAKSISKAGKKIKAHKVLKGHANALGLGSVDVPKVKLPKISY